MIQLNLLTLPWIEKISKDKKADKILVEKVNRALLLVEGLQKKNLPFIFKGGTALMILTNSTNRLSIDIDIVLETKPEEFDKILDEIVKEQGFLRKELNKRESEVAIPKEHYKFIYQPIYKTIGNEEHILLDILFEKFIYKKIIKVSIESTFVPLSGNNILVNVPSLEDILADKLTAFAPNTTGIPYFKKEHSMSMEIMKQLYDIGNLFDVIEDIETIKTTFAKFAKRELGYRDLKFQSDADVLEDIFQTSLCLSTHGIKGKGNFAELQSGITKLRSFIFSDRHNIDKAITKASKAAYLSKLILTNQITIEKYKDSKQIENAAIDDPEYGRLQKLKKTNPEAFFYWWKALSLKKQ